MNRSFADKKRQILERQLADQFEEYEAVATQLRRTLDSSSVVILKRQMTAIEQKIKESEKELEELTSVAESKGIPPDLTADTPEERELPQSVTADKPVISEQDPSPETTPTDPQPKIDPDSPNNNPLPDNLHVPTVVESSVGFVKQWLWVQFLLWTAVSALSFVSDLGGVLDLTLPTRLLVLGLLVFVGGAVILGISLLPAYRANYHLRDRRLTAALWLIISAIILWSWQTETGRPFWEVGITTPTPTATITPTVIMTPAVNPSVTLTVPSTPILPIVPLPVETGSLIYFDDFESIPDNWPTWSNDDGRAWYENGGYNVRSYANTRGWMSIKLNDHYSNIILEVDAVPITHELVTGYGIAFNRTEKATYYSFEVQAGGECGFIRVIENRRVGGFTSKSLCPSPTQNENVRVRLEIHQEKVVAFINETFAGQKVWEDNEPYAGGYIGLGVYNSGEIGNGAQAQVRFDNLAIWRFNTSTPDYPFDS